MPKRTDIKSILILGAGPIVIGQACEFDYSGTQACKSLREEGYRLIVVNSNPSTIMTDCDMADATYIEPIQWKILSKIIEKERPDALLPTVGGQTALNCVLDLDREGVLKKYCVELIGATLSSIVKAENRQLFRSSMRKIGLKTARSGLARTISEALLIMKTVGLPCIIRPSFTLGGTGGGIARTEKEFRVLCESGFDISSNGEILIDESLIGWKEYEMEVMRDKNDNCIIVCSIENVDPMGIHTGDSITVAPAQTLTDKGYQIMRNASIAVLREIGVETGGSNVQFSINPVTGVFVIVEMNPRVSRSSALASKATGFPIAKIAAKLAVGYTLDELMHDRFGISIPTSFEPSIDYVVTKIPRFSFEKFRSTKNRLTTQMKSIGEVMAIGCTQQESLQKALRSLEIGSTGFDSKVNLGNVKEAIDIIYYELEHPGPDRIWYVADAFRIGISLEEISRLTCIDQWFLSQIEELIFLESNVISRGISCLTVDYLRVLKSKGFSDARLGALVGLEENKIRDLRNKYDLHPLYKKVDTCAAEFFTNSSCVYSTYSGGYNLSSNQIFKKIMILGGGPNRIGQGIEFDYCCVHAALAFRNLGYKTIMVNCNPETVSTDYDISDYLYFEPVTLEDILEIVRVENPEGIIVQYGGQTPLKLSRALELNGVSIIGTSVDSIDRSENRARFQESIRSLGLKQPQNVSVVSLNCAVESANKIGYPLLIRPSYVLGGRSMEIVYHESDLLRYFRNVSYVSHDSPVLLDQFIENAIEVDVDAICDGENVLIAGIMEHIEQAGIHSGDSACSLPVYTLNDEVLNIIRNQVQLIAFDFRIFGLMNVQFAVKNNEVYLLEINPRASRTVPFVSKATGLSLVKISAGVLIGKSLFEQGAVNEIVPHYFCVKEVLLPFLKFPETDPVLGPEMRSTGEVMGIGKTFSEAFSKAIFSSSLHIIKRGGCVLLSVFREDHKRLVNLVMQLLNCGFSVDITYKTAFILKKAGFHSEMINNVQENSMYVLNKIKNGEYTYIIDTTARCKSIFTSTSSVIRQMALQYKVCYSTTLNACFATLMALDCDPVKKVTSIQEVHAQFYDHF